MAGLAAERYAGALYEAAEEQNEEMALCEEAKRLLSVWRDHPELRQLLAAPGVTAENRVEILNDLFAGRVSDLMMGFFTVAAERDRQSEIEEMLKAYIQVTESRKKLLTARVVSAVELDGEQKQRIQEKLQKLAGAEECRMRYRVNPELLGGLIIRVDGRLIDASVRTQLMKLKKLIASGG